MPSNYVDNNSTRFGEDNWERNMIFITLGSQKFQFNRLLQSVDDLIYRDIISDSVFAQTGCSDYIPKHYKYKAFLNRDEFVEMVERADVVITHGGTGAIIGAVKKGKKVIAVPRLSKYGEHIDDHQIQLISQFNEMNLICPCYEVEKLAEAIEIAKNHEYNSYQSNTENIIKNIERYLQCLS